MSFISYAQNNEDVLLWRVLKNIPNGFYVDVGANDPFEDSVTQAFYEHGWRGINIEPMVFYFNRLVCFRPLDINLREAIANQEGELTFYEIPETGLSTLDIEVASKHRTNGWNVIERKTHVQKLNEILAKYSPDTIHFLKIDVEGTEKDVLTGLDLSIWRPWIILIESTNPNSNETNAESWEHQLLNAKYEMVYFDGINYYFLANEHCDLLEGFKIPPNILDNFVNYRQIKLINENNELKVKLSEFQSQLKGVQQELNQVYNSRSFKITKPLRELVLLFRVKSTSLKRKTKKVFIHISNIIQSNQRIKSILLKIINNFPTLKAYIKNNISNTISNEPDTAIRNIDSLSVYEQNIYNELKKSIIKKV